MYIMIQYHQGNGLHPVIHRDPYLVRSYFYYISMILSMHQMLYSHSYLPMIPSCLLQEKSFRKPQQKINLENELSIDNVKIEMKTHTKFLGVLVNQHLTFEEHCKFTKGNFSRGIGILYKANKYLSQKSLLKCTLLSYTHILHIALLCGAL